MQVVHERCCGLDIHKKTISACAITPGPDGQPQKAVRNFGTMTDDLETLAEWLRSQGVTHVAMESTGVYWQPIYNVLEDDFSLLLANARYIKAVPGRKTDVRDCEWIADCLRHGLLKGSFVPDRSQRELRELTRYRTSLTDERSAEINRLQKTLEGANIKLASVATDVLGKSGREMLELLVAGTVDAAVLADLAKGRLREKIPQLERALTGRFGPHQRFLVAQQLAHIDGLDEIIARLDAEIAEREHPFEEAIELLDTIPGFGRRNAENLLAEIGTDMSRFPSAHHLASWARMCPGTEESAGKRKSSSTGKGNPWLRRLLVQSAHSTARTKTYLGAQFRRLSSRRGKKKAAVAVGHSQLVIAYHMLSLPMFYTDLGPNYFDERAADTLQRRLVGRLEKLGYEVVLRRKAA
jgi:transposase